MKNSVAVLTKRQKKATVEKWAAWILKQQARAAKTKPRADLERI
jgi:hypothetical protein